MNWPGERFLEKMWTSLIDNGIGGLLAPWQQRRIGRAAIDVEQKRMIEIAKAEFIAEKVRLHGVARLEARQLLGLSAVDDPGATSGPTDSVLRTDVELVDWFAASAIRDAIRRETNVAQAILYAEEELKDDSSEPCEAQVDADWLLRWRESAAGVSAEHLQTLWGRILAGEVRTPGQFSLRAIEFLRNLSVEDAKCIEEIAKRACGQYVLKTSDLSAVDDLPFSLYLKLAAIGIISSETFGHAMLQSRKSDRFEVAFRYQDVGLLIQRSNAKPDIRIGAYFVTPLGQEVLELASTAPDHGYLQMLADRFSLEGCKVSKGRAVVLADTFELVDLEVLSDPTQQVG